MGVKERRDRESRQLRAKILAAAAELIEERGHEKLTIRLLAEKIEYSPRTIYLYFGGKNDLLQEVVEHAFSRTLENTVSRLNPETMDPVNLLEQFIRQHIAMAFTAPNFYRTVIYLLQEKGYTPGPNQRKVLDFVEVILQRYLEKRGRPLSEVHEHVFILAASLRGFTIALLNRDRREGLSEDARNMMVDLFLAAVLPEGKKQG